MSAARMPSPVRLLWGQFRSEWRLYVRDRAAVFWTFLFPLLMLFGMGAIFRSGRPPGLTLVRVAPVQESERDRAFLKALEDAHLKVVTLSAAQAEERWAKGDTTAQLESAGDGYRLRLNSYLIAQGHRRIGHIYGDLRYLTARLRLDGYRCALSDHGIHADDELIAGGTWTAETARAGVAHLFSGAHPPTAIFVASDDLAFIVIEEIRNRGYRIPADVSVIGFDDVELARQKDPPLTTVRIPLIELGRRAVDLVLDTIQAGPDNISTRAEVLPVELVRRGSA